HEAEARPAVRLKRRELERRLWICGDERPLRARGRGDREHESDDDEPTHEPASRGDNHIVSADGRSAVFRAPTLMGDSRAARVCDDRRMTTDLLTSLSTQLADAVAVAAPSVVQVQGRRRPASGLVYADDVVLTTVRALGREDGLHVRRPDGHMLEAALAGWDPTTSLAVLRVAGLEIAPIRPAEHPA